MVPGWSRDRCPPGFKPGALSSAVRRARFLPSAFTGSGGEEPLLLPRLTLGHNAQGSPAPPRRWGAPPRVWSGTTSPPPPRPARAWVFGEGGVPLSLSSRLAVAPLFLGGSNGDGGTVAALAGDAGPCHPFRSFPHKIPTK
ncbi:hypothetical protein Sjap_025763 [Stephania japonica]|uniref:Uncharacterized protein n=1 Tax=Stephania japonica TaxID=461633 RepID=A0AAP0E6Q6_9MAGN